MNPLQFNDLLISFTCEFLPLWNDKGSGAHRAIGLWRPSTTSDALSQFFPLGDIATGSYRNINQRKIVAVVSDANKVNGTALRPPADYEQVWKDAGSGARNDFSIWRPLPPEGYVAMGLVCGVGYEKPSSNAVRCVRADLVTSAQPGDLIWSDEGSGASRDFSAWSIRVPDAAPGEINLAPGTFVANASYTRPTQPTYALRLPLSVPLNELPPPPALNSYAGPDEAATTPTTHVCLLPWFSVKDPELNAIEQLQSSPTYRLERTDRHLFAGFGHNTTDTSQPFMWTANKGETGNHSRALAATTCVDLCSEWPPKYRVFELNFSAHLEQDFTHTQRSAKGWNQASSLDIITYVPANKAVAAYLIQSEYRLLRQDGSQVSTTVSYTSGDQIYMSEFPREESPPAVTQAALEVASHDLVDETVAP